MVYARSKGNPENLMFDLGSKSNNLVRSKFVEVVIGKNGRAREVINQHFRILIGDG